MANLATPPSLGDSNRNRVFVDVQADECVDLRHEPFSWKTSPAGSQGLHNWTASTAAKKGHCHLGLQVAPRPASRCPGALDERGLEPRGTFAQTGRTAVACAFVVAGAQPGPRDQVPRARE